jgi:hypothetical protein
MPPCAIAFRSFSRPTAGRQQPQIAVDTGTTPQSVPRCLNAYLSGGLYRLHSRKAKRAKLKLTVDLAPVLRQGVIDGPAKQGLDQGVLAGGGQGVLAVEDLLPSRLADINDGKTVKMPRSKLGRE